MSNSYDNIAGPHCNRVTHLLVSAFFVVSYWIENNKENILKEPSKLKLNFPCKVRGREMVAFPYTGKIEFKPCPFFYRLVLFWKVYTILVSFQHVKFSKTTSVTFVFDKLNNKVCHKFYNTKLKFIGKKKREAKTLHSIIQQRKA